MGRIAALSLALAVFSLGAPVKGEVAMNAGGQKTELDVLGIDAKRKHCSESSGA